MSASARLVLLDDRFPNTSRMTRYRISQEPDFPDPVIVRNRRYYYENELSEWEARRRIKRDRETAAKTDSEETTA